MSQQVQELLDRISQLERENSALAAGQCIVKGGLIGDEYGNSVCTLERERDALREMFKWTDDQLVKETWNAAIEAAASAMDNRCELHHDLPAARIYETAAHIIRAIKRP